jgi:hypothetical protein
MNSLGDLSHVVEVLRTVTGPHIYKYESRGLRFRDSNGDYDSGIAQNSNGSLAFYSPCNIDSNGFTWFAGGAETTVMTLDNVGNLDCLGDVSGFNQSLSDSNFKTNIQPYTGWSNVVNMLQPVSFVWNDATPLVNKIGTDDVGLLAQDVAQVYPLAHTTKQINGKDVELVKYEKLIPVLLAAIKSHEQRIVELEARLNRGI